MPDFISNIEFGEPGAPMHGPRRPSSRTWCVVCATRVSIVDDSGWCRRCNDEILSVR